MSGGQSKKKIIIIDDHPMMREGLRQVISADPILMVAGEAGSAAQADHLIESTRPDLVITDLTMPGKSGLEMIKDIRALHPDLSILVISMHDETFYAERVLRAGARGYIMKQEGGRKIMEAVHQVLQGKIFVSEKISEKILELFSHGRAEPSASPVGTLTDREFEVFELIGAGLNTAQIAAQLHISPKTAEVHRTNAKLKLKLRNAAELIRYAVRWAEAKA